VEQLASIDWAALAPFIAVGFAAQMVDGALGMAFGVIASTLMVGTLGVAPRSASAAVHLVEMFTTAASGISHIVQKNVDWRLFWRLVGPGVVGGVAGAYLLSISGDAARPFVMTYLTLIGLYLIFRAFRKPPPPRQPRVIAPLGLIGGFLDAAGGGGWGPVVTSNLLIQGASPRMTIGTVNTAEFVLTTVISITFVLTLGWQAFTTATVGVLIGGVAAAPLGAILVSRVRPRLLMGVVGVVLTLTSAWSIWLAVR
jgi:uncharacterized membrane protein YfcA